MDDDRSQPGLSALSERERVVLRLMDDGLSNREIAQRLIVAPETVKWYAKQIYSKLETHSRTQAITRARELGLFDDLSAGLTAPRHNLRASVTSFVGRKRELGEVRQLLKVARLATLTGPGGSGKTRLALEVAWSVVNSFADGAWFVPLASIREPDFVLPAIAATLGISEAGTKPLNEAVRDYLRDKQMLLLLDNFEQVIGAAPLIEELLAAAPKLRVMVTSRELLRVYGEHHYPVPPLDVLSAGYSPTAATLLDSDAVTLFVDRAQAARPDFQMTDQDAAAVAEICLWLDGLPLAIELAAAHTRMFSPQMLVEQFEHRLDIPNGGVYGLPQRQQTLRTEIDWSYDLLSDPEKQLFARLGVFVRGWTLEAAEAICAEGLGMSVVSGLESLLDKSLIANSNKYAGGQQRLTILGTLQEYAVERLAQSDEEAKLRERHAAYFAGLAEKLGPLLRGTDEFGYAHEHLLADQHNLNSAMDWSLSAGRPETALRIGAAMWYFWYMQGRVLQAGRRLEDALKAAVNPASGVHPPAQLHADALRAAATLAYFRKDYSSVRQYNEQALELYRRIEDEEGIAACLNYLGNYYWWVEHDSDNARACYEESIALSQQRNAEREIVTPMCNLGFVEWHAGNHARGRAHVEAAMEIARRIGTDEAIYTAQGYLEEIFYWEGRYAEATDLATDYLRAVYREHAMLGLSIAIRLLGAIAAAQAQFERATRLFAAARALVPEGETMVGAEIAADRDRRISEAREALGPERFGSLWAEGEAMTIDQAVACALAEGKTG